MIRWLLIVVLVVGVAGTAFWGYQEHQEKNAILLQAENNYQRAFHDLSYNMDLLHDKIGAVLAMNSASRISPQLTEIWRLTSEAHSNVGQLPLALMPFNKTEEFLSNIGKFTYQTAIRDLSNKPLNDDETKRLQKLYDQSGQIEKELRQVQYMTLKNHLRWMDVQLALATNDKKADNTIIDGFKTVEKTVKGFDEGNFGPTMTGTSKENHPYQFIKGEEIDENKAKEIARDIFNIKDKTNLDVANSGKGADLAMYSISYDANGKHGYMDISKKGGHPITVMMSRDLNDRKVGLYDGMQKAVEFLKGHDYKDMEAFQSSQYQNIGVYNFIAIQDGVRIYPDSVQVKVALDNGDILGLSTRDFLRNHQERKIEKPSLTKEEARAKVNPNVKIHEDHLAIIDNNLGEEVLCYEFLGTLGNSTYRIFINAQDGFEEKVEKLKESEVNFETSA